MHSQIYHSRPDVRQDFDPDFDPVLPALVSGSVSPRTPVLARQVFAGGTEGQKSLLSRAGYPEACGSIQDSQTPEWKAGVDCHGPDCGYSLLDGGAGGNKGILSAQDLVVAVHRVAWIEDRRGLQIRCGAYQDISKMSIIASIYCVQYNLSPISIRHDRHGSKPQSSSR